MATLDDNGDITFIFNFRDRMREQPLMELTLPLVLVEVIIIYSHLSGISEILLGDRKLSFFLLRFYGVDTLDYESNLLCFKSLEAHKKKA